MDLVRLRSRPLGRHAAAIVGVALVAVVLSAPVGIAAGSGPSKGPIPSAALTGGAIDKSLVPDFIPALDRDGTQAGYVAKDLAIPDGRPINVPIPVYGDDLKTIVGHMYPGRGFVGLGASPGSVPTFSVVTGGEPAAAP